MANKIRSVGYLCTLFSSLSVTILSLSLSVSLSHRTLKHLSNAGQPHPLFRADCIKKHTHGNVRGGGGWRGTRASSIPAVCETENQCRHNRIKPGQVRVHVTLSDFSRKGTYHNPCIDQYDTLWICIMSGVIIPGSIRRNATRDKASPTRDLGLAAPTTQRDLFECNAAGFSNLSWRCAWVADMA